MEIIWKDLPFIEEEEAFVSEDEMVHIAEDRETRAEENVPVSVISSFEKVMKEKTELFQALIDRVNEHEVSYIERHSWLFGR